MSLGQEFLQLHHIKKTGPNHIQTNAKRRTCFTVQSGDTSTVSLRLVDLMLSFNLGSSSPGIRG